MNASTLPRHPLRSGGTTRRSRLQAALLPSSFRLDDRAIQDLIVTAHDFASTLRYIGPTDSQPEGVYWDRFWEVESLTYLAIVAAKDTERIRQRFYRGDAALKRKLDQSPAPGRRPLHSAVPEAYLLLLRQLHRLAWSLEQVYRKLVAIDHPLRSVLLQRIRRDNACDPEEMNSALKRLIALHRGADPALDMEKYRGFFADDNRWGLRSRVEYDAIAADPAISRKTLREIFTSFYDTWVVLKNAAQASFNGELARMNLPEDQLERAVQPHIALFLAFLQLFRHAQDSLNEFGQRHLDYYYEQVLRLRRRAEMPDEVFLVIELAKGLSGHLLEAGTALLAGKDKNGRPLVFETIEDWVIRPAQVADVKTIYFDHEGGRIRANPDIAAVYDNGAVVPNEKARYWRALGDDAGLPDGEVGFAIASPQLILREGRRIVDVRIDVADLPTAFEQLRDRLQSDFFMLRLSAADAWIELEYDSRIDFTSPNQGNLERGAFAMEFMDSLLRFRIVLDRDDPPVDQLGPDLAASAGFATQWPVLQVLIKPLLPVPASGQAITAVEIFELFRHLVVEEITITVKATDIRENLIIQSDQGIFDGTQKIFPFGPVPEKGNRFYIGSTEIFQKALSDLKVVFTWIAAPENFATHYAGYFAPPPRPKVLIEFVDRAEEKSVRLESVTRQGVWNNSAPFSFKVYDLNFNPLSGVAILQNGIDLNAIENPDEPGQYSLDPTGVVVTTDLEISLGDDSDFEVARTPLQLPGGNTAAAMEIVLLPREKKFNAYNNLISGFVRDIDGKFVSAFTVNTQPATNGAYTLAPASLPGKLDFTSPGLQPVTLNPLGRFSMVDTAMYPTAALNVETVEKRPPTVTVNLKGTIQGAFRQLTGATLSVGGVTAQPLSQSTFEFPGTPGASRLIFDEPAHRRITIDLLHGKEIEVRMLPKEGNFTVPIANTALAANAIELNFSAPLPSDLANIVVAVNGTTHTNRANGTNKITLQSISGSGPVDLTITHNAGLFKLLSIDNVPLQSSVNNISLALEQYIVPSTPVTAGKIKGTILDFNGLPVNQVRIAVYQTAPDDLKVLDTTGPDGIFEVAIPPGVTAPVLVAWTELGSGARIMAMLGFDPTVPIAGKDIVLVLGEVVVKRPFAGTTRGKVFFADDQRPEAPLRDVRVTPAGGTAVETDENGNFVLTAPVNTTTLDFYHPLFEQVTVPITDDSVIDVRLLPLKNIASRILTGKVEDIYGNTIPGVSIRAVVNNVEFELARTNSSGEYRVPVPASGSIASLVFVLEGFRTVTIDFNNLPATPPNLSHSLLDVRMRYDGDNLLDLIQSGHKLEDTFDVRINALNLKRDVRTQHFEKYSPTLKRGFLRLTLKSDDFRHLEYPQRLMAYAFDASRHIAATPTLSSVPFTQLNTLQFVDFNGMSLLDATTVTAAPTPPNQPYTPATNSISLDYTSTQSIVRDNDGIDRYFQLLPFNGHKPVPLSPKPGQPLPPIRLVYPFTPNETVPVIDASGPQPVGHMATGNLYIGVADLEPGTNLSLLVEIAAGTEPEPEQTPARIFWSYLAIGDVWKPFSPKQLLRDTTHELTRSGLLQFAMPSTAARNSTMLDSRYYWLRASTDLDPAHRPYRSTPRAMPSIVSIRAQAVTARFRNNDNDLAHLAAPLPAATIGKLALSRTAVKKITQPLESFGGRLPETAGLEFYQRVSERLRHKDRAVTPWDYQHLLLERFPEVAAAKCIPHTRYKIADDNARIGGQLFEPADHGAGLAPGASELTPGYVTVAVVPDLRRRAGEPWPEPRFPKAELDELRVYLGQHTNLFVDFPGDPLINGHLQVVNPLYEAIDVAVNVEFYPEVDAAFHRVRLAEEIRAFISPWLETPEKPPAFNRVLRRSEILQFIEERPYVDYVYVETGLKVTMPVVDIAGNAGAPPGIRLIEEDILLSTARSILVAGRIVVNPVYEELTVTVTLFAAADAQSALPGTPSTDYAAALTAALTRFVTLPWSGSDRPSSFARLLRGQDIVDFIEALPYRSELTVDPPEVALTNRPFDPFRQAHPAQAQFRAIGTPPDAAPPAEIVLTTPDSVLLLGSIALQSGVPATAKLSAGPGKVSRPARAPRKKTAAPAKPEPPPDPAKPPRRTRK